MFASPWMLLRHVIRAKYMLPIHRAVIHVGLFIARWL